MAEFLAFTPTPNSVHFRALELTGHKPCWLWTRYRGGPFRMDHYRRCSYCGCIHPGDLMALLRAGRSSLKRASHHFKRILITPNPMRGRKVRAGENPAPVFGRDRRGLSLIKHLSAPPADPEDPAPSISERLTGHYDRPLMMIAPEMIEQPFYLEHTTDQQWDEILIAMSIGERKKLDAAPLSSA